MTVANTLKWASKKLNKMEIENGNLDSEVLLSFTLKKPRAFLFTYPEKKLTNLKLQTYKLLIKRRAKGEPVAYLTGQKEFYGLHFKVNPDVLIPRPETELMIDYLKDNVTMWQCHNVTIIDVGTGSGCIPIAVIKTLKPRIETSLVRGRHKNIKTIAIDASQQALKIARLNAQRHGVKIKFLRGNLLEPFIKTFPPKADPSMAEKHKNNLTMWQCNNVIILANLPYLTTKQWKKTPPDVRLYEPRQALDGGPDGLKYFRQLFQQIKQSNCYMLHVTCYMILEIDPSQTKRIKRLIREYSPKAKIQIKKDLAGRERVVIIKLQTKNSQI